MVKATGHKQTQAAQLVVAAGAGGASSLISCPAELIMIQQQKTGRSLMTEAVSIFQRFVLMKCVCLFLCTEEHGHSVPTACCVCQPMSTAQLYSSWLQST